LPPRRFTDFKFVCEIPARFGGVVMMYNLGSRVYCLCQYGTFEVPLQSKTPLPRPPSKPLGGVVRPHLPPGKDPP